MSPQMPATFVGYRKGEVRVPRVLLAVYDRPKRMRVRADDGNVYTIKQDEATNEWVIHRDGTL